MSTNEVWEAGVKADQSEKRLHEKGIWILQLEKKKVLERYEQSITSLHYYGPKKEQL